MHDRTALPAQRTQRPTRRPGREGRRYRHNRAALLFLGPWLTGLLLLTAGPMVASLYLSFTEFDILNPPTWVGLENYRMLFGQDERYLTSLRVTFLYVAVSVPLKLVFALAVAMTLRTGLRGLGIYRAVYYVPSLLGGSVAVAVMWRQVFDGNGLLNQVLAALGVEDAPAWIANPDYSLWTLIALSVWQFGSPMIIFLAGLNQIPQELHEAAAIDGAGAVRRTFSITLPLLTPIIFFNLVLQGIGAFQSFTPSYIVSNGTGGPLDSTLLYTLYLFQKAFTHFEFGYASAMAWVLLVIIGAFTAVVFLSQRLWVFYGDES